MKKLLLLYSILFSTLCNAQNGFTLQNREFPCVKKEFQVYVHITIDSLKRTNFSTAQLDGLFKDINKAFEPICFSFNYCKIDTIKDYSFDYIDGSFEEKLMVGRFQQKKRINLYLVDFIISLSNSRFNSITDWDSCFIIVNKKNLTSNSTIHELGNIFGLYHTNESIFGLELVDGSNCETTGDLICDTPADPSSVPFNLLPVLVDCKFVYKGKDANGDFYESDLGNYMSPWDNRCMCGFSNQQYRKMVENYLNSNEKPW